MEKRRLLEDVRVAAALAMVLVENEQAEWALHPPESVACHGAHPKRTSTPA
jgi:hypothetical protein